MAHFAKVISGHSLYVCAPSLHPSHFYSFIQQQFPKLRCARQQDHRDE